MKRLFNLLKQKNRRKYLRNNMTGSEIVFWSMIKNSQLGYKFRRQYSVGSYILDFYCPQLKLCVEIDGDVHDYTKTKIRDRKRDYFLKSLGINVKRYRNEDIEGYPDKIIKNLIFICNHLSDKTNHPNPSFSKEGII